MTAKAYLEQIRNLERQIRRIDAEIYRNRALLLPAGVRYDKDKIQVSPEDKMAEILSNVADLTIEQLRKKAKLADVRYRIIEEIHLIGNANREEVLYMRYVLGLRYEAIADAMHYSVDHIKRLHGWGLHEFERKVLNYATK